MTLINARYLYILDLNTAGKVVTMQTFLPYASFKESAKCLDNKRLGNQRREILSILTALSNPKAGWQNHPATKMWRGYEFALFRYGVAICREWISRGYKDSCEPKIFNKVYNIQLIQPLNFANPHWLGNEDFHNSHKAALLAKDPEWYGQFGWSIEPKVEYIWPI